MEEFAGLLQGKRSRSRALRCCILALLKLCLGNRLYDAVRGALVAKVPSGE